MKNQPLAQIRVVHEPAHGLRQCCRIRGVVQHDGAFLVEHFRYAHLPRDDHRNTAGHSFQRNHPEGLVERWSHYRIRRGVVSDNVRAAGREAHTAGNAGAFRVPLIRCRIVRPDGVQQCAGYAGECVQDREQALSNPVGPNKQKTEIRGTQSQFLARRLPQLAAPLAVEGLRVYAGMSDYESLGQNTIAVHEVAAHNLRRTDDLLEPPRGVEPALQLRIGVGVESAMPAPQAVFPCGRRGLETSCAEQIPLALLAEPGRRNVHLRAVRSRRIHAVVCAVPLLPAPHGQRCCHKKIQMPGDSRPGQHGNTVVANTRSIFSAPVARIKAYLVFARQGREQLRRGPLGAARAVQFRRHHGNPQRSRLCEAARFGR